MVQLNDIYKTSIVYILCIDETKLDSNIENAQFHLTEYTAQKMKFSIKDLFSKCDQIRRNLRIWSHLLEKSLMKNLIFYAVKSF